MEELKELYKGRERPPFSANHYGEYHIIPKVTMHIRFYELPQKKYSLIEILKNQPEQDKEL